MQLFNPVKKHHSMQGLFVHQASLGNALHHKHHSSALNIFQVDRVESQDLTNVSMQG